MDERDSSHIFTNNICSHFFCYECITSYITSQLQQNKKIVTCPEIKCKASLNSNTLRSIIPKDVVTKWDEALCKSLIHESQIVYCPFKDCSALLVNDSQQNICATECPECNRLFCAQCNVPWHSGFSCKQFGKKRGKTREVDGISALEKIAKKKKWRKCPGCEIFVEKTEGCLQMTCRCSFKFCYRCGATWTPKHYYCRLSL